jgi:lysozyme family protein
MNNLHKYNDFLFESILNNIFLLLESEEPSPTFTWDIKKDSKEDDKPVTFEWDIKKKGVLDKLKTFLSKLPKEKIKEYFYKLLEKVKLLPEKTRRSILINYAGVFLLFTSITYLTSSATSSDESKIVKEFIKVTKKASFDVSQKVVALAEGDYSDDRKDTGNFVEFEMGGKILKRFIGSKYGISAPVLQKYLGKLPKKEDMINLSYETALDIYKTKYWDQQDIEKFCNQSVANLVYDGCVNQGVAGMKSVLRNVLRENGIQISDDSNPFDPEYIKQLNILEQNKLFNSIKKNREDRYKDAKTYKTHGDGWLNRLEKINFME